MRQAGDGLLSGQFDKKLLVRKSTSGSTGMPLQFYHSRAESVYGPAFELRQMTEVGVSPFDLMVHVVYHGAKPRILQGLGLFRRACLPMNAAESDNLAALNRLKPSALLAFPSALIPLARANMDGAGVRLEKIFSYAESLRPEARRFISRSFGSRVYDMYGSIETSWAAWECEHGSMHVHSDYVVPEILDEQGEPAKKGRYGSLVLTPLWRTAMPLIRYAIGDRAAFAGACRCGRGLQAIRLEGGRDYGYFVLPSGKLASTWIVSLCLRPISGILSYQALQKKSGEIVISLVTENGGMPEEVDERLMEKLRAWFSEPVEISITVVDRLRKGRGGKAGMIIPKVNADAGI